MGWLRAWYDGIFGKPDYKEIFGVDSFAEAALFYEPGRNKIVTADVRTKEGTEAASFSRPIDQGTYWILGGLMESEEMIVVLRKRDKAILVIYGLDIDEEELDKRAPLARNFHEFLQNHVKLD